MDNGKNKEGKTEPWERNENPLLNDLGVPPEQIKIGKMQQRLKNPIVIPGSQKFAATGGPGTGRVTKIEPIYAPVRKQKKGRGTRPPSL